MADVFDYVKSINLKTEIENLHNYNPYLTNMALSYSMDTAMLANEMNLYFNLPPSCQYDFLFAMVRKGKRFNKWYKKKESPDIELIMQVYSCSRPRAIEYLQILSKKDIEAIKQSRRTEL